jgi:hypothetical protein
MTIARDDVRQAGSREDSVQDYIRPIDRSFTGHCTFQNLNPARYAGRKELRGDWAARAPRRKLYVRPLLLEPKSDIKVGIGRPISR